MTLTFQRPLERFNKHYFYEIYVGSKKLANLKNGRKIRIEIPTESEDQDLSAKIQWCGSEKINLKELNDSDTLKVVGSDFLNRKGIWIIVMLPLAGALIFGFGKESFLIKYLGIGMFVSILVFAFWGLIIAKNKWLKIEKV